MTDIKYKAMIVDDDEFLLNMYSVKFKNQGFEVQTAGGGLLAIEKLKAGFKPDVLILDIVMPTMDGFELLEIIRKEKLATGSVVIVLTNQGAEQDITRATKIGIDGYIVKASTIPSEVLTEVLKILKEHKK